MAAKPEPSSSGNLKAPNKVTAKTISPRKPPVKTMISNALDALHNKSGTSLHAVKKYVQAEYLCDENFMKKNNDKIKTHITDLLKDNQLKQVKGTGAAGSFKWYINPEEREALKKRAKTEEIKQKKKEKENAEEKGKDQIKSTEKQKKKDIKSTETQEKKNIKSTEKKEKEQLKAAEKKALEKIKDAKNKEENKKTKLKVTKNNKISVTVKRKSIREDKPTEKSNARQMRPHKKTNED